MMPSHLQATTPAYRTIRLRLPALKDLGFFAIAADFVEVDAGDDQLVFGASVVPAQETVAGADVEGVAYTIESAVCEPAG